MEENRGIYKEEPRGLNDAYAINLKTLVEQMASLREERQGQMNRFIEDTQKFRAALDQQYLSDLAGIRSLESRVRERIEQDTRDAKMRKETGTEERGKELEEVFNKVVTSGANQQNAGTNNTAISNINELIAGVASYLIASGVMGASQQTSGECD